jgi:hypothetical protein
MIILYLFLFLIALLLLLLISPIKGYGRFDVKQVYFKGSYFFGLIRITYEDQKAKLRLFGFKIKMDNTKDKDPDKDDKEDVDIDEKLDEAKEKKKKKRSFKRPSKEVILLALRYIKTIIKKIAPKKARLSLTLGLDDPYYTEMMHIISIFLFMPLNKIKNYNFSFTPVHDDIAIDYSGEALINFSIMSLILPTIRFFLRKPIREYLGIKLSFKRKTSKVTLKESA